MVSKNEIVIRLILSAIIGAFIGAEREVSNRPAGLRTHILVSVSSTLIMLVSIDGFYDVETGMRAGDPFRLAAQVVSGIGFLGAGTIIKTGSNIKGLTTAASLWASAGIGLAIGSGYYLGGLLTAAIVLLTLMSLRLLERRAFKMKHIVLEIISSNRSGIIGEITTLLGRYNIKIKDISMIDNEYDDDGGVLELELIMKVPKKLDINNLMTEIYEIDGVFNVIFDK